MQSTQKDLCLESLPIRLSDEDMAVLNDLSITGEDIPAEYLEAIINSDIHE